MMNTIEKIAGKLLGIILLRSEHGTIGSAFGENRNPHFHDFGISVVSLSPQTNILCRHQKAPNNSRKPNHFFGNVIYGNLRIQETHC